MQKSLLSDSPPFTMFIMLGFTMVSCFLFFMFIGILLAPPILGVPVEDFMNIVEDGAMPHNLDVMRYLQVFHSVGMFLLPAFFAAYLFSKNTFSYLGLLQGASFKWFAATFLLMFAAIPCINLLVEFNKMIFFPEKLAVVEEHLKRLEENARQMTLLFLNVDNAGAMFFNIFMMAMLPAIGEELIFRGLLHKIFVKWTGSIHAAIIVTGFLFSLMHLQFYGFFPRWVLGVIFGYMMVWSGSIWLPIFAHFLNNAAIVCVSYLIHKGTLSEKIEDYGTNAADIPVIIAATSICAAIMWMMWRKWKAKYNYTLY